ncbi:unnamed protein product, partial [Didymodactylos carnosus]
MDSQDLHIPIVPVVEPTYTEGDSVSEQSTATAKNDDVKEENENASGVSISTAVEQNQQESDNIINKEQSTTDNTEQAIEKQEDSLDDNDQKITVNDLKQEPNEPQQKNENESSNGANEEENIVSTGHGTEKNSNVDESGDTKVTADVVNEEKTHNENVQNTDSHIVDKLSTEKSDALIESHSQIEKQHQEEVNNNEENVEEDNDSDYEDLDDEEDEYVEDDDYEQPDEESHKKNKSQPHDDDYEKEVNKRALQPRQRRTQRENEDDVHSEDNEEKLADDQNVPGEKGEQQEGESSEIEKKGKVADDDEDFKSPAFVPRKGQFYEHDDRMLDEKERTQKEVVRPKQKLWKDSDSKWKHDRYRDEEQGPKSTEELYRTYGSDIRTLPQAPTEGPVRGFTGQRRSRGANSNRQLHLQDYMSTRGGGGGGGGENGRNRQQYDNDDTGSRQYGSTNPPNEKRRRDPNRRYGNAVDDNSESYGNYEKPNADKDSSSRRTNFEFEDYERTSGGEKDQKPFNRNRRNDVETRNYRGSGRFNRGGSDQFYRGGGRPGYRNNNSRQESRSYEDYVLEDRQSKPFQQRDQQQQRSAYRNETKPARQQGRPDNEYRQNEAYRRSDDRTSQRPNNQNSNVDNSGTFHRERNFTNTQFQQQQQTAKFNSNNNYQMQDNQSKTTRQANRKTSPTSSHTPKPSTTATGARIQSSGVQCTLITDEDDRSQDIGIQVGANHRNKVPSRGPGQQINNYQQMPSNQQQQQQQHGNNSNEPSDDRSFVNSNYKAAEDRMRSGTQMRAPQYQGGNSPNDGVNSNLSAESEPFAPPKRYSNMRTAPTASPSAPMQQARPPPQLIQSYPHDQNEQQRYYDPNWNQHAPPLPPLPQPTSYVQQPMMGAAQMSPIYHHPQATMNPPLNAGPPPYILHPYHPSHPQSYGHVQMAYQQPTSTVIHDALSNGMGFRFLTGFLGSFPKIRSLKKHLENRFETQKPFHWKEHPRTVEAGEDQRRLLKFLFDNYNELERPVQNDSDTLTVKMNLALQQIIDLVKCVQNWIDYSLKWSPEKFGNITTMRLPSVKVWTPDILLYNSADEKFDATMKTNLVLQHNGSILYVPPGIFKSICPVDISDYPF